MIEIEGEGGGGGELLDVGYISRLEWPSYTLLHSPRASSRKDGHSFGPLCDSTFPRGKVTTSEGVRVQAGVKHCEITCTREMPGGEELEHPRLPFGAPEWRRLSYSDRNNSLVI